MTERGVPRRFYLDRHTDVTGASGVGIVAEGVVWTDGTVSVRWLGERASVVFWHTLADAEAIHEAGGAPRFVWLDTEQPDQERTPRLV